MTYGIDAFVAAKRFQGLPDAFGELLAFDSPTTAIASAQTNASAAVALGFTWRANDNGTPTGITSIEVCARGFATLIGSTTGTPADYTQLFTGTGGGPVEVAAWWSELETLADGVRHETQGSEPRRRCVVEWHCMAHEVQTADHHWALRFQIVFNEIDDSLEFRYSPVETVGSPDWNDLVGAAVGINNGDGTYRNFNLRAEGAARHVYGGSDSDFTYGKPVEEVPGLGHDWPGDIDTSNAFFDRYPYGYHWTPAIPVPKTFEVIPDHDMIPGPVGGAIVRRVLRNVNALYATHRPPIFNAAPDDDKVVSSQEYVAPIVPSADGLSYDVAVEHVLENTSEVCGIELWEGDASEVYGGSLGTWNSAVAATTTRPEQTIVTVTIAATTRFLKIRVTNNNGNGVRLAALTVRPSSIWWIDPDGPLPSGAALFNEAAFDRFDGPAVHTELFNRAWEATRLILRDRRQAVGAYFQAEALRFALAGNAQNANSPRILWGRPVLRGQTGATLAIKLSAKVTGTGSAIVTIGEEGGNPPVTIPITSTSLANYTATLDVASETPILFAKALLTGVTITVRHLAFDWTPGD